MKPSILVLFVVLLAFAVVSANHHKKHRGNARAEEYATTSYPGESYGTDVGDFTWPEPIPVENIDSPTAFGPARSKSTHTQIVPTKQHGRSGQGSVSH